MFICFYFWVFFFRVEILTRVFSLRFLSKKFFWCYPLIFLKIVYCPLSTVSTFVQDSDKPILYSSIYDFSIIGTVEQFRFNVDRYSTCDREISVHILYMWPENHKYRIWETASFKKWETASFKRKEQEPHFKKMFAYTNFFYYLKICLISSLNNHYFS